MVRLSQQTLQCKLSHFLQNVQMFVFLGSLFHAAIPTLKHAEKPTILQSILCVAVIMHFKENIILYTKIPCVKNFLLTVRVLNFVG